MYTFTAKELQGLAYQDLGETFDGPRKDFVMTMSRRTELLLESFYTNRVTRSL
jgi:hypothetical protein